MKKIEGNMAKKMILTIIGLTLVIGMVCSEKILEIDLEVFKNDSVNFHSMKIIEGNPSFPVPSGDYKIEILDSENNKIFEKSYKLSFVMFTDPPTPMNSSILYLKLSYDPKMRFLRILHNDKEIFSRVIEICNKNGICEINYENFLTCPEDCPLDKTDGICIKDSDNVCDPDCSLGVDPDCEVLSTTFTIVSTTIKKCGNGICEQALGENFAACPQDCKSGGSDGYCDGETDKICDPDCKPEFDMDCKVNLCGNKNCDFEEGENFANCPQDCASGGKDNYCDKVTDKICDSDCLQNEDSDCVKTDFSLYMFLLIGLVVVIAIVFFIKKRRSEY